MIRKLLIAAALMWPGLASAEPTPSPDAFSQPLANLSDHDRATVHLGNSLFRKSWRPAPSETMASDGLGPLYNARSCADCHFRDGRGRPPNGPDERALSLILRLAKPDPVYGGQIQNQAVPGQTPEARVRVHYEEHSATLADGEIVHLRRPEYRLSNLGYGPLASGATFSPRLAPAVFGLGLLEAIAEADIRGGADPDDLDGEGISGRANDVRSAALGRTILGRFGWKAGQATIADQNAAALSNDIGIANPLAPALWGDCTALQSACRAGPHGDSERHGGLEVSSKVTRHLAFYLQGLAPPPARDRDLAEGRHLFRKVGCAACHREHFVTGDTDPLAALRGQTIRPFTDLLLHDMGDGLADSMREGEANEREWRTAPLWGIGLTKIVSGHSYFLHDGRARNLMEAILWHGGEAQAARDAFAKLAKSDRAAILAFLNAL
jgi:CxxC motif-containing protein (DUF1111 family)